MVQTTGAALEQRWNNRIPLSIRDKRVEHWFRELWENKTEMCNFALAGITEPCVLMQIDADETWRADQLEKIVSLFDVYPSLAAIKVCLPLLRRS